MPGAFFGRPSESFITGGMHVTVYLVPVFEGRLVVFDVSAREAQGRWLPWDVLAWGANPYEAAAALGDNWCGGAVSDLRLVDLMSFTVEGGSWELAAIFRAELSAPAAGDDVRVPYLYPPGEYDAIGGFDPVDLERWVVGAMRSPDPPRQGPKLVF
jgi:hypothetical protein